ncbi:MAG: KpsF/GutQ family sugar-phosphate isomerase [Saprospiraceae bacterium]
MLLSDRNKILEAAIQCLEIECQSLLALKQSLNDDFVTTVNQIRNTTGRLVVTGIGKSAIIGQKIVATLNSTGTPSMFMHAADAIHGDLGMIQTEDIVLCISKSGETSEIKVLIPLIKLRKIKLIGMCSNENSFLSIQSDYVLHIPIDKEAEPNNLAPTASTTSQMAMGDAIAVSLLALRGFTPEDFAHYHPGGSLGKQLYLTINDFRVKNYSPFVNQNDSLKKVLLSISSNRMGATAVLNDNNKLIGIITDGDLRRLFESRTDFESITAKEFMNPHPKTIQIHELAVSALKSMQESSISQLLVLQNDEYIGVLHLQDLLKEGII